MLGLCCAWALYFVLECWRKRSVPSYAAASVLLAVGGWFKPVNTPVVLGAMPLLALFIHIYCKVVRCSHGMGVFIYMAVLYMFVASTMSA